MIRRAGMALTHMRARARAASEPIAMAMAGGAFTTAGFTAHPVAGWIVAGASVLLVEWSLGPAPATPDGDR
jgi:hypothetical protein